MRVAAFRENSRIRQNLFAARGYPQTYFQCDLLDDSLQFSFGLLIGKARRRWLAKLAQDGKTRSHEVVQGLVAQGFNVAVDVLMEERPVQVYGFSDGSNAAHKLF